jgi:flagellar hook assembly protein FlgD
VTSSVTDTLTQTLTRSPTPTQTITLTITDSPTASPSPIPVPDHLVVAVYNSAGERVRLLYDGGAQSVPTQVDLPQSVIFSGLSSASLQLGGALLTDGSGSLSWNGLNDGGQAVGAGAYYFKLEFHDPFGATTSFVKGVQVLQPTGTDQVSIFNSAGEMVWSASLSNTAQTSGLSLSQDVLLLDEDPVTGATIQPLGISLSGSTVATWDGRDIHGGLVASGNYMVEVVSQRAGTGSVVETKSLLVMDAGTQHPDVAPIVGPNPWRGTGPLRVDYHPYPGAHGSCVLYNLAGERLAGSSDLMATGTLWLQWNGYASGIYLLDFRQQRGPATLARRSLKLAVVK